jgi:hypothetical protein
VRTKYAVYDFFIRHWDNCVLRKRLLALVVARIQYECWLRELLQELSSAGAIILRLSIHYDQYGV